MTYCDDEDFVEFNNLGIIRNSSIAVFHEITYNEEFYILINVKNCNAVRLNGLPLRINKSDLYVTYNNPMTDKAWSIEIVRISNNKTEIQDVIIFPERIRPKRLIGIKDGEVYILDEANQTWKTGLKN